MHDRTSNTSPSDRLAAEAPGGTPADRHPHLHAFTHAVAVAGQVYADTLVDLVTSHHPPEWQQALDEYDRTHPQAGGPRASDAPAHGSTERTDAR